MAPLSYIVNGFLSTLSDFIHIDRATPWRVREILPDLDAVLHAYHDFDF